MDDCAASLATRFDWHWKLGFAGLAAIAIAWSYAPALDGPLVFDDLLRIELNPLIQIEELSVESLRQAAFGHPNSRPLAFASLALTHRLGDGDPGLHRRVNVLIHWLNSLLTYAILRELLGRLSDRTTGSVLEISAISGALVFALHPIQIQAVSYVVQRMASMGALFYLAGVLLFLRSTDARSRRARRTLWCGVGLCWLLALGCKENTATLPAALALIAWLGRPELKHAWLTRRRWLLGVAPLAMLALVLALGLADRLEDYARHDFDATERVMTQARVIVFYLSLVLWPAPDRFNLAHHFVVSRGLLDPASTLWCGALLLGLLGLALWAPTRHRLLSFGLLWLFLHLAIESTIVPLALAFEHRMYLPMLGCAALVAGATLWLCQRWFRVTIVGAGLLSASLAIASETRNAVWADDLVLWQDAARKSPRDARALSNLGVALGERGRSGEALEILDRAVALEPPYANAFYNRGLLLYRMRQFAPASADLERAVELEPEHLLAIVRLGFALAQLERHEEALRHFASAAPGMAPDPRLAQVIDAMSESLIQLPRSESSPAATLAAIEGLQSHPALLHALSLALVQRDETTLALTGLERAAGLAPDDAALARDLGIVLVQRGYLGRALRRFEQALRLDPDEPQALQLRTLVVERIQERRRAREGRGT